MSDTVIRVENLSKRYFITHQTRNSRAQGSQLTEKIQQWVSHPVRRMLGRKSDALDGGKMEREEFWALKDVSFDVKRGDVLGIIGRNGAGKSTLLKILSRITEPTRGEIKIKGRIASLLEVGTGFHPELTGRENIFLNGSILGMSRSEIQSKFDEIVAFAEVEKFLDTQVKHYSSGMYVRLAFAVAAHLDPEILIVDEVLAVGDAQFQKKCLGKMQDIAKTQRTVLFVSHNMAALKALSSRAILFHKGTLCKQGSVAEVSDSYLLEESNSSSKMVWDSGDTAPGENGITFRSIEVSPPDGHDALSIDTGVLIDLRFHSDITNAPIDVTFYLLTADGLIVCESGLVLSQSKESSVGWHHVYGTFPPHLLNSGRYAISVVVGRDQRHVLTRLEHVVSFEISNTATARGSNLNAAPGIIRPIIHWSHQRSEAFVPTTISV